MKERESREKLTDVVHSQKQETENDVGFLPGKSINAKHTNDT